MSLRTFAPSSDERVIAGVCAGIAQTLAVDPTLVRLVFALLALAGGAGILLYLALWAWTSGRRIWIAAVLAAVAGAALLGALGLSDRSVIGIALIAGGLALAWRQGGSFRPEAPLSYGGLALVAVGAVALLSEEGRSSALLAPGAVAGALLLIAGPWVWRLALERDVERTARIRSEERSDMAARVHDSVLQTLALIQRHATSRVTSRRWRAGRSGSCAAGCTATSRSATTVRRCSRRCRRRRATSKGSTTCASSWRVPATARSTPPWARSCSRRARR
jgi:phage shock protein PspC (stress-responsive transcriptional regulator)